MDWMDGKQNGSEKGNPCRTFVSSLLPEKPHQFFGSEEYHDTCQQVESHIRDVVADWVQLPEPIVNRITENTNGLIGTGSSQGKNLFDIRPFQTADLLILDD